MEIQWAWIRRGGVKGFCFQVVQRLGSRGEQQLMASFPAGSQNSLSFISFITCLNRWGGRGSTEPLKSMGDVRDGGQRPKHMGLCKEVVHFNTNNNKKGLINTSCFLRSSSWPTWWRWCSFMFLQQPPDGNHDEDTGSLPDLCPGCWVRNWVKCKEHSQDTHTQKSQDT